MDRPRRVVLVLAVLALLFQLWLATTLMTDLDGSSSSGAASVARSGVDRDWPATGPTWSSGPIGPGWGSSPIGPTGQAGQPVHQGLTVPVNSGTRLRRHHRPGWHGQPGSGPDDDQALLAGDGSGPLVWRNGAWRQPRFSPVDGQANAPGRARPAGPAAPGVRRVDWDGYVSTITIGEGDLDPESEHAPHLPALVQTYLPDGSLVVQYPGTAFRDGQGDLHIDARGAPVSGPWAHIWSPDSFRISEYGQVTTLDDIHQDRTGQEIIELRQLEPLPNGNARF